MISNEEVVIRLILSAIVGGIVGMEREASNRPAGLRTHVLVTLGSALIMLISMYGFGGLGTGGTGGEPARLAAQVVSGIGFLGAGTILRTGNSIRGLTTAASIWVCGGIGLAIGNGYYLGGIATTIIVFFTLRTLGVIEKKVFKSKYKQLIVQGKERAGLIGDIGHILGTHNTIIKDIKVITLEETDENEVFLIEIKFMVKIPSKFSNERFFDEVIHVDGVENALWNGESQEASYNLSAMSS